MRDVLHANDSGPEFSALVLEHIQVGGVIESECGHTISSDVLRNGRAVWQKVRVLAFLSCFEHRLAAFPPRLPHDRGA